MCAMAREGIINDRVNELYMAGLVSVLLLNYEQKGKDVVVMYF